MQDNFRRVFKQSYLRGRCKINLHNADAYLNVSVYNYRSGSKAVIKATILNVKSDNDIFDIRKVIKELEEKVGQVVNN